MRVGMSVICKRISMLLVFVLALITDQTISFLLTHRNFLVPLASKASPKPVLIVLDDNRPSPISGENLDISPEDRLELPANRPKRMVHKLSMLRRLGRSDGLQGFLPLYVPGFGVSRMRPKRMVHKLSLLRRVGRSDSRSDDFIDSAMRAKRVHTLSLLRRPNFGSQKLLAFGSDSRSDNFIDSAMRAKRVHTLSLLRRPNFGSQKLLAFGRDYTEDDATRVKRMHHLSLLRKIGGGNKLFRFSNEGNDIMAEMQMKRTRPLVMFEI